MFHSTTILAVRHRDHAVLAGDGQVTFGQTVVKHGAKKIRRLYNDRILAGFAGSAADSFALFSRFEAKLEQYRGNLERSAVELAKDWRIGSHPAPPRGDADRPRQDRDVPAVGQRRSDRARRWDRGDRIGRTVRARRREGAGAATPSSTRAPSPRRRWRSPARSASTPTRTSRSKSCSAHPASRNDPDLRRHAHAAADRRRARQVRRRSGGGQARGRDRAAQPDAAAEARAGARRGNRAEEHPDDRADRRRQDRDRAPAGAARAVAVPQGRGVEVHRSRLRRPRRRVDGPRSRRARRRHGARGAARGSARARRGRTPRSGCSTSCCRRRGRSRRTKSRPRRATRSSRRASAFASSCAPAVSTRASSKSTCARSRFRRSRSSPGRRSKKSTSTSRTCCPGCSRARRKKRKLKVPEALEYLAQEEEQKLIDMDSVARAAVERVEQAGIIFLDEIDKIAGREGSARPRRQPRRRAARHPADRRRHDGQHQVRDGADRSHPVHRRRRLSRLEAVGSDSRAAGPLSDPRRARGARQGRVRPHPHRAAQRARSSSTSR